MTALSPDVRDSTRRSLRLTCPSVELVDDRLPSASTASPAVACAEGEGEGEGDADGEWSDEEALLPKSRHTTHRVSPRQRAQSSMAASSSGGSTKVSQSPSLVGVHGGALIPPQADVQAASSQDDILQCLYRVTRERDALKKELRRTDVEGCQLPAHTSASGKSAEKTLIQELHALREEIRTWSDAYFGGPIRTRSRRPRLHGAKETFGNLSDQYHSYLRHADDRPLLIQAYVWSRLQQNVFSNWQKGCGYLWAGKLGDKHLRAVNDTLRRAVKNEDEAEQYHRWRACTVNMLVPQTEGKWQPTFDVKPVFKHIARVCSRMRRRLRPWSSRSLREGREQLHTIVSASVALDLKMKGQRADYRFVTFTGSRNDEFWGYDFYESEMEDVSEGVGEQERRGCGGRRSETARRVELAVAPALERCGTAAGHVFDQSLILVKADVSCRRLDRAKQLPRNRVDRSPGARSGVGALGRMWSKYAYA